MNQIHEIPDAPEMPGLDEFIAVRQGTLNWTQEQLAQRERDPAFILHEAEACIVIACLTEIPELQEQCLTDALELISELPTAELRDAGLECLQEILPQRLSEAFESIQHRALSNHSETRNSETVVMRLSHAVMRHRLSVSAIAILLVAVCVGLINVMSHVTPQFASTLTVILPNNTPQPKTSVTTAHYGDKIEFHSTLQSERLHRWGIHINDREARWINYSQASDGRSEFHDLVALDASTCIEYYLIIAADEPLPGLPLHAPENPDGIPLEWLSAICRDLQTFGKSANIQQNVREETMSALREAGYNGTVEVYSRHYFHSGTLRRLKM